MAISSNQLAVQTARAGLGRAGLIRAGFAPKALTSTLPDSGTPGTPGGAFYVWERIYPPTTTWTRVYPP